MIHEDGIYFGLPHDQHIADPALGGGDHKDLAKNPTQWWMRSAHSAALKEAIGWEDKEQEDTLSQAFGTALHTRVLEGREVFDRRYWVRPRRPEGLMSTSDELREGLRAVGADVWRGLNHLDLILMARMHREDLLAQGLGLEEDWLSQLVEEREEREEISTRWGIVLELADRMLDAPRAKYEGKSQRQIALVNGMPEVSIFWTDERGVRCKCRFDYLRIGSILDLKSYAAREDEASITSFLQSTSKFAYDMQAALYLEGREQMARLAQEGRTFGDHDPAWLDKVIGRQQPPAWVWLAVQTIGLPETDLLNFTSTLIASSARHQVTQARDRFVEFRDRFGMEEPWVEDRGTIDLGDEVFEAQGLARRMTGRADEAWRLL